MPNPTKPAEDAAAQARRMLHEDRVSPAVDHARQQLSQKSWVLHHARDYVLGVLQLLESVRLLRDVPAEKEAEEIRAAMQRSFSTRLTDREDAYRQLTSQIAALSGIPGAHERLELIEQARDGEEYRELTRRFESDELPRLVKEWREERRVTAEAAVERVRGLLDGKRKTVPMQALREALGAVEES